MVLHQEKDNLLKLFHNLIENSKKKNLPALSLGDFCQDVIKNAAAKFLCGLEPIRTFIVEAFAFRVMKYF